MDVLASTSDDGEELPALHEKVVGGVLAANPLDF
jgi:hypothetical protein